MREREGRGREERGGEREISRESWATLRRNQTPLQLKKKKRQKKVAENDILPMVSHKIGKFRMDPPCIKMNS